MDYTVKVDTERNRVELTLKGLFSDELTRQVADEVLAGIQQVKPGFCIITDIAEFKPLTQEGVNQIRRVGGEAKKLGMKATIRIVGASAVAKLQFERVSHEMGYPYYTVTSWAEAERAFAEVSK